MEQNKTQIFNLNKKIFINNKAKLKIKRMDHNAIELNNGNILIFGGITRDEKGEQKYNLQSEIYYK